MIRVEKGNWSGKKYSSRGRERKGRVEKGGGGVRRREE